MKFSNVFRKKEISLLWIIFCILSIFHICYAAFASRGLFIDGMFWFPQILDSLSNDGYGFWLVDDRTRWVTNFLNQLPINITYWFGCRDKSLLLFLFSFPLFLFPFLANIANIILAKRTKRYDIVLFSLFFYSFGILPAIMYSVVEVYLGASLLFLLFHYFVADIEYNRNDIFIIILLCTASFALTEVAVFSGIVIFFLSFHIIPRITSQKEKIVKVFISISEILAAISVAFMNFLVLPGIQRETKDFFSEIIGTERNIFVTFWKEPYILEVITLVIFFCLLFKKQKMAKCSIKIVFCVYLLMFSIMILFREIFLYNFHFISYRVILFILFPILIFILFVQEVCRRYIHKNLLYNLFVVTLILGISNTLVQFFYSYKVIDLKERYYSIIEQSNSTFISPDASLLQKVYFAKDNIFFAPLSPTADFLALWDEKKIKMFVLPFSTDVVIPMFKEFEIDSKKDLVKFSFIDIDLVNEFWDMSIIEEQYIKNKKIFTKFTRKKRTKQAYQLLDLLDVDKNGTVISIDEHLFINRCSSTVRQELKEYLNKKL